MRLTTFAATGGIGRQVLEQALAAGHDVTAVVRSPRKLPPGVRAVACDLAAPDPATLESAIKGADAVLSGLGARSASEAGIAWQGTQVIVQAMKAADVRASSSSAPRRSGPSRPLPARNRRSTTRAMGSSCGSADVAHLMLRVLGQPEALQRSIGIAY
jgi:uncharacterized protein YbjT (DUF2867 family)